MSCFFVKTFFGPLDSVQLAPRRLFSSSLFLLLLGEAGCETHCTAPLRWLLGRDEKKLFKVKSLKEEVSFSLSLSLFSISFLLFIGSSLLFELRGPWSWPRARLAQL